MYLIQIIYINIYATKLLCRVWFLFVCVCITYIIYIHIYIHWDKDISADTDWIQTCTGPLCKYVLLLWKFFKVLFIAWQLLVTVCFHCTETQMLGLSSPQRKLTLTHSYCVSCSFSPLSSVWLLPQRPRVIRSSCRHRKKQDNIKTKRFSCLTAPAVAFINPYSAIPPLVTAGVSWWTLGGPYPAHPQGNGHFSKVLDVL